MGLKDWLARLAVQAPHVLVVETPGAWRVRVAVDQEMARRGWRSATAPADADLLAVCGTPPSDYTDPLALAWDQLPGPRAQVALTESSAEYVAAALDRAVELLLDDPHQRADAEARTPEPQPPEPEPPAHDMDHGAMDHGAMDHGAMDHGAMDHGAMDHGAMDHGAMDHGAMDHGAGHDQMDMTGPGGVPLAAGGPDRDGLDMDVLHLRLGPVLPHWPAGLVLALALQGDVVTEATVERLVEEAPGASYPQSAASAAYRCDAAATVLMLAGAPRLAGQAYRARDQLLEPATRTDGLAILTDLRRRIGRSAALRWSLRDLAPVPGLAPTMAPPPAAWRGDVHDRLLRLLDLAQAEAQGEDESSRHQTDPDPGDLTAIVVGAEFATVRLAIASVAALGPALTTSTGRTHG